MANEGKDMRKKFAPIALVFGIFSTLLLSSGASAQAAGLFTCGQSGTVVTCVNLPYKVTIDLPVNVNVPVNILSIVLTNLQILTVGTIETAVQNFLNPIIAPNFLSGNDITVCYLSTCG
jgi:hypothetical protein